MTSGHLGNYTTLTDATESLDEAIAFDAEQAKILECVDAEEIAVRIERRITDQSGQCSVWIGVEEGSESGCGNSCIKRGAK
jgi:hypothetical protein